MFLLHLLVNIHRVEICPCVSPWGDPWGIWGDPIAPQSLATRLKENMEKLTEERDQRAAAENREKEQNKRLQRQLRDVKEEMGELAKKEAEASRKKHELVRHP